jgi:thioredoxin-like negative regulator of GroEL
MTLFSYCNKEEKRISITNPNEYNKFIIDSNNITFNTANSEKEFWSKRLRPDSSGIGDLGPLAKSYTTMYEASGEIIYLKEAEKLYRKAIIISAQNKDIYVRKLAKNLIVQRQFSEAKLLLEESFKGKSNKRATQFLLFDVNIKLGNYSEADKLLGLLENTNDYNYLLRLSKWMHYKGNNEAAIRNLEEAMKIADSRKSKTLQIWTYTQLAKLYTNSERVKEAYQLILKTLELQPDHSKAKKQLAWILYSYEKNSMEAKRILNSIMTTNKFPELLLFKAEIAEFEGNISESNQLKNRFIEVVSAEKYGSMYHRELIEIYSETIPKKALQLAKEEIKTCNTPDSYALLAYSFLKNKEKENALLLMEEKVEGKTNNPRSLYFQAIVFKAAHKTKKVDDLKVKLNNSAIELGNVLYNSLIKL